VSLTIRVVAAFVLLFVATLSGVAYLTDMVVGTQLTNQAKQHIRQVATSLAAEKVRPSGIDAQLRNSCRILVDANIPLNAPLLPQLSRWSGYAMLVVSDGRLVATTADEPATARALSLWRDARRRTPAARELQFDMVAGDREYRVAAARRARQEARQDLWLLAMADTEPVPLSEEGLRRLAGPLGYGLLVVRVRQEAHALATAPEAHTLGSAEEARSIIDQCPLPLPGHSTREQIPFEARVGGRDLWVVARRIPSRQRSVDRWILVVAGADQIAAARGQMQQAVSLVALTGMGLVIVVAYLIALSIASRARKLAASVSAAFAEPAQQVRTVRGDEIDVIEQSFEDLMARLEEYQRRLVANERLAVMGRLSASVVHEIRNPLTAMKLTAQMLEDQLPEPHPYREGLEVILGEVSRLQDLCEELLVLSGRRRPDFAPLDAADVVRQTVALLAPQSDRAQVRIEAELPAGAAPIRADRNQLRQLLLNLLLNAIEASAAGGRVRIGLRCTDGAVELMIDDWGSGIDPQIARRAGEGLVSTKQTGAGLGLAVCRRIVDNHHGALRMHNRGDGTTATVTLPTEPPAEDGPYQDREPDSKKGPGPFLAAEPDDEAAPAPRKETTSDGRDPDRG
jgi:signal transduction histidine kinase